MYNINKSMINYKQCPYFFFYIFSTAKLPERGIIALCSLKETHLEIDEFVKFQLEWW